MRSHQNKVQIDGKYRSSFLVSRKKDGKIVLDAKALRSLIKGLNDAKKGSIYDLGIDFTEHLDEERL